MLMRIWILGSASVDELRHTVETLEVLQGTMNEEDHSRTESQSSFVVPANRSGAKTPEYFKSPIKVGWRKTNKGVTM